LLLQVYTTVDLELAKSELMAILKALDRPCKWVQEHRLQIFVINTWETAIELRTRLGDVLVDRPGIGGRHCFTAPEDLVGQHGEWDGLRFHIEKAYVQARERDRAYNMGQAQRRHVRRSR
jgi:hypothetical protein